MPQAMPRRPSDDLFAPRTRREARVPHAFVLDALARVEPTTRAMFGSIAVYVGEKIVLILRERHPPEADDGVWIATTKDHHASLRGELPSMRSISVFGLGITGWQVVPSTAPDYEEAALRVCAMILAGDGRIGKIPAPRRVKRPGERAAAKTVRAKSGRSPRPIKGARRGGP
jgi:hypothetical protein